jgi:hypothetical protein
MTHPHLLPCKYLKKTFSIAALFFAGLLGAQNVNQFTGSFNYQVPLLILPSNRGEAIGIDASYAAGIQVNQAASEIGLGWNLSAGGAIYRSVSGVPDDAKTHTSVPLPDGVSPGLGLETWQGALYPEQVNGIYKYDLATVRRGLDSTEFTFPDYDHYSVAGPGYSGKLKLSYLRFYGYDNSIASNEQNLQPEKNLLPGTNTYYRKPQFHFEGDFSDTLTSRHYTAHINGSTPFHRPTNVLSGPGFAGKAAPYIGEHQNGGSITNQNLDTTLGRLATSNLVEYFTNDEITTAYYSSFTGTVLPAINDFIDYPGSQWHYSPLFPAEGIGAFRITASNGLTYHYSLPVYEIENTNYYFPLEPDYTMVTGIAITDIPDGAGSPYDFFAYVNNQRVLLKSRAHNKTAVKWLLTAITGADFKDVNGNHLVDDVDMGYWVSYDYQLWNGRFAQRSPRYGYNNQYSPHINSQSYPAFFPLDIGNLGPYKLSGLYGSANLNKSEVYHLNKIRTSSHTAIFVRDVRNDEKGADTTVDANATWAPDLLLKRIVLFKNEHLDSILNAHPTTAFNIWSYSSYDFSTTQNTGNIFSEPWFQAQYNNLKHCILKHVAFDQDYSLCRNYHGNLQVNWAACDALKSPADVEANISTGTYSLSGKLTLNRIVTYDFQDGKVTPSILLDYDKASPLSNPDYNPRKMDYWGYYKSDATQNGYSGYTTLLSAANTKAWSLHRITDQLGGITEMEYESNTYSKVIDNQVPGGVRGPAYIYRIRNADGINANLYDITMEEGDNSTSAVTEFLTFNPASIPNMTAHICIPFCEAPCDSSWTAINTGLTNGFLFGSCTFSVNPGGGGSTNHVKGAVTALYSTTRYALNNAFARTYYAQANASIPTLNNYETTCNAAFDSLAYSGNGFLMCQMPIGYTAYGNGIRLKKLKRRNRFSTSNETYVTEYSYEDGVATAEMDRFNYQVLKSACAGSAMRYDFLEPKTFSAFELGPSLGYSKVTVKDLGRINNANGKTETTFITDLNAENGQFDKDYNLQTQLTDDWVVDGSGTHYAMFLINEYVNNFSSIFGNPKETKVFDKNNNLLTKTIYEYEPTQQGALVENFYFRNLLYGSENYPASSYGNAYTYTVNIFREYPTRLKNTKTYSIGNAFTQTESLQRDEITGESISMRSGGGNQSSSISFKRPAYTFYQAGDNIDFTQRAFRTILPLGNDMYSYANIDSGFTSSSFLKAGYRLYSRYILQRQYNASTGLFATATATLPYYASNRSFAFNAGAGSGDAYGLLDKSNLYSNPLSVGSMTNTLFWEPGSTYNWKLLYEHTLLDQYKNMVETRDANNRFSAQRFGYKGYHQSASVSNCNYASFTFGDFETPPAAIAASGFATVDGDLIVQASNTFMKNTDIVNGAPLLPHSGTRCVLVAADPVTYTTASQQSPGSSFEIGLQSDRIYRASVWTHTTNLANAQLEVTLSGTVNTVPPYAISNIYTAIPSTHSVTSMGNWVLLQMDFEVPANFSTNRVGQFSIQLKSANNGTVYFDDLVFHPVESNFSASVFNPRNGRVTSMIDGNGLATNFVYDAAGRTLEVWKEIPGSGYKLVKSHTYNYARGAAN